MWIYLSDKIRRTSLRLIFVLDTVFSLKFPEGICHEGYLHFWNQHKKVKFVWPTWQFQEIISPLREGHISNFWHKNLWKNSSKCRKICSKIILEGLHRIFLLFGSSGQCKSCFYIWCVVKPTILRTVLQRISYIHGEFVWVRSVNVHHSWTDD
jgi:hypothetical protein